MKDIILLGNHLSNENSYETIRIKEEFESSSYLRETIKNVLIDAIEQSNKKIRYEGIYKLMFWKDYVADQLGYQRALKEVQQLLED